MKAVAALVVCCVVGSLGYNVQRDIPYNVGPDDPYAIEFRTNFNLQPSQRLFWDKFGNNIQGSNQVGGTGLWSMLTNKFPILTSMFGRMEYPNNQYGVPTQNYQPPGQWYQPTVYSYPQGYNFQQFIPNNVRDVGLTDDAVIVTPPFVPAFPPPAAPGPAPAPVPSPEPSPGYHYDRPQYRLELPHK